MSTLAQSIIRRNHLISASKRTFSHDTGPLVKTSLYDWHLHHGGKMVPFAGYELPVQYEGFGVLKEHLRKFYP